jgi:hypothetical protein
MLDRNSIVDSNGSSQAFLSWPSFGNEKKLSPLPLVPLLLHPNVAQDTIGTSSYFTHVDVCFGLLITALLCKFRIDINQLI